jgi:hypothetical protein
MIRPASTPLAALLAILAAAALVTRKAIRKEHDDA